jgi:hypothetical protein
MREASGSTNRQLLRIAVAFIAGIMVAVVGPWLLRGHFSSQRLQEIARVTSPDGTVDAVLWVDGCGAMCSDTYLVSVVPRGAKVPTAIEHYAFSADDMTDGRIRWRQSHLLEISYRRALINQFRNLSYPFAKPGNLESWNYKVELRLAPTSQDFSYLREPPNH